MESAQHSTLHDYGDREGKTKDIGQRFERRAYIGLARAEGGQHRIPGARGARQQRSEQCVNCCANHLVIVVADAGLATRARGEGRRRTRFVPDQLEARPSRRAPHAPTERVLRRGLRQMHQWREGE